MTAEEIKQQYSMRDVVEMYGFHLNKAGFISCPFHSGDHSPSMKIYQKDFHCHACGANGDIFTFVQRMDNCSFKDAFLTDWQRKKFEYQLQQKKEKERKELERKRQWKREILQDIPMQKLFAKCFPVFSDDWCAAVNRLEYDFYILDEMNREGVKLFD
mgnify:CR=1 FL=1